VEKEPLFGGTTAYSAGVIWIPNSRHAREAGIADSSERALEYLSHKVGNRLDRAKARVFLERGPEMLDFLENHTHAAYSVHPTWADYEPTLPGGSDGGRSLWPHQFDGRRLGELFVKLRPPLPTMMLFGGMMIGRDDIPHMLNAARSFRSAGYMTKILLRQARDRLRYARGTRLANGNALIARLALSARERNIPLWLDAPLTRLLRDDSGAITGAEISRGGQTVQVHTRRAVILATGGFPRNEAMTRQHYPHLQQGKNHRSLPPSGNSGDGARLVEQVGGSFVDDVEHPAAWAPVSLVPQADGSLRPFPHFIDRGKPGVIAVDRRGRRFANEAGSYHQFVPAMIETCRADGEVAGFLITDQRALRRYGLGAVPPAPLPLAKHIRSGYLTQAKTLTELAGRLGIDAAALEQTVARHNRFAERGEDPDFGKGSDSYNVFNGDPKHKPNPCLAPIATPPFYGLKMIPGELGTFAGIKTDANARVLDRHGQPLTGLYAVGNDMASVMGGTYPGAGITIGPALTFGYIAGCHVTGRLQENEP
jgi:succinate dehydrogenase/fumarate reductase flavoprotein subunit